MLQDAKVASNKQASDQKLQSEVEYRKNIQEICNKIYAASNLDEILVDLKDEITGLFECERLTVYVVDGKNRELVSRFKSGDEIGEIRIPVSNSSISGCSAFKQKLINIKNVYDDKELASIDPELRFDKSWDKKTGFITKQVLVVPVIFKKFLLGAIQLINRPDGTAFTKLDEEAVTEMAKILGIALYNQKRMAKARPTKFDYFLENNILTQKELDKTIADARQRKEPIENVLMNELKISKQDIGKSLSQFYKAPFAEYNKNAPIPGELITGLKVPFMRNYVWVPLRSEDDNIIIAIDNPLDLQKVGEIKALFPGKSIVFHVALKDDILEYIKLFTHDEKELASMDDILSQLKAEESEIEEAESSLGEEDSAVVQLVNKMIIDAYNRGTSDIHIEPYPGKNNTQVRIRVDGACQVYQTIPYAYRNAIVSRLKIMSDLDIAERRKPQDGKIKFKKYGGLDIELRVATVPTQGGMEDVVMRILAAGEPIPLDKMGFSQRNYDNFVSIITKPYGIVFVCGPTGSGKTTTLHSALGYINKVDTKIWTAEDPVEITQRGLRQVQVQKKIGFDFAMAMRAFLRADPDVIMVGEMRDKETTSIGIEASLTGHLVFSTLHTNSAPESITRLLDMGMDPFNFSDAILGILAQRLARTLCKKCKEPYHPAKEEYDELVREYGGPEKFERLLNIPYTDDLTFNKPAGCAKCNNSGNAGRCGIHELLMGTDPMKKLIQLAKPMEEIKAQALKDGMTTLKQDGISKIFSGLVDLKNVRKVCIE
ncbi:MAG: GspE/PulE family protein [Desulfobacterales bacterium]|uniref:GspE/PulE family protein n=1 Tax=Candidatus Desulfatibia profunda TaxID=2841695 RepID=A0A8J6NWJ1_9BACT|nr:GspE/PulE family protein [Candidatus Desulfatibia profunda]MBL7179329.1 GspE/PulE family protein [Desulfobacterales bacterium]